MNGWPPPRIDELDDDPVSIVGCTGTVIDYGGMVVKVVVDLNTMRYPAVGTRVEIRVIP